MSLKTSALPVHWFQNGFLEMDSNPDFSEQQPACLPGLFGFGNLALPNSLKSDFAFPIHMGGGVYKFTDQRKGFIFPRVHTHNYEPEFTLGSFFS